MKKIIFLISMFFVLVMSAQVKVGDNPTTVHSSAMLQVDSSTKGFLPPRMTNQQMTAIDSPAKGLMVYCTNCSPAGLYTYSGSAWNAVGDTSSGGSSSSGGVSATMAIGGTWIWGGPNVTRNIVINITNNSFSTAAWSNANTNLVLSGGNTGLTVGTPSPATTSIASGSTGTITFPVTGSVGTMDEITATWTKLSLTVVGTQAITPGSATFTNATNNAFVFSANASGVNVAGTLPLNTTVAIPYTSGVGKYEAYTSPDTPIASTHCNDGASDWTFAYSYPAGTFATSGNLTATLITKKGGVVAAWPAKQVTNIATIINDATWSPIVVNGNNLGSSFTVGIDYGGDAIRGQLSTRAAAYDVAAVNSWVPITLAEYNLLATNVPGIQRKVMTGLHNTTVVSSANHIAGYNTSSGNNFSPIPANSYIVAFLIKSSPSVASSHAGAVLKINATTAKGTYESLNPLPAHFTTDAINTFYAWVKKRPTWVTTNAPCYTAIYGVTAIPVSDNASFNTYIIANDVNDLSTATSTSGYVPSYQLLTTTIKSW